MSIICSYQNCLCVKYPCSSTAFFRLPSDNRRPTWIRNSGNKALQNIGIKAHRYFCENHFRECDIKSQFNRKILRKHAVPIAFGDGVTKRFEPCNTLNVDMDRRSGFCNASLSIDKVGVDANICEEFESTDLHDDTFENNDDTNEGNIDISSAMIDFYLQQPCEADESSEENCAKEMNERDDLEDIIYDDSDSHRPDSSTVDIQFYADDNESETEIPINNPKPTSTPLQTPTNDQNETTSSSNDYDEDRHFALSLVGYFQRLQKDKKAIAKLKILQYLTALDIGLPSNL